MARAAVFEKVELPSFIWQWRSWEQIQSSSWFTKINWINIATLFLVAGTALYQARSKYKASQKAGFENRYLKAPNFPEPEELPNFDCAKTEPLQLRPFKPKYHLTMALETLDPSELLLMDKSYPDRIKYRTEIIRKHTTNVVNLTDEERIAPAIREYYSYVTGTYLPLRYPSMFKLHKTDYETGQMFMLENKVTGSLYPSFPVNHMKPTALLELLGKTIDEDVLFLLPEELPSDDSNLENPAQEGKYCLLAYVTCYPSGFNPSEKLGHKLASIHGPVPGYKEKLEGSMDRFFSKLEIGKYVKRTNWSVTVDAELYAVPDGKSTTHAHEGDEVEELETLDVDKTVLRTERQTLHRLPTSKAIVFAFKTYTYPLSQIKAEGNGEALATAVDGLRLGNVGGDNDTGKGGMWFYKRGAVWGRGVKEYLTAQGRGEGKEVTMEGVRRR